MQMSAHYLSNYNLLLLLWCDDFEILADTTEAGKAVKAKRISLIWSGFKVMNIAACHG